MQFVSTGAICQLGCQLSCKLSTQLSAQVQLSAQLHSVNRLDPLPRLNSILPAKLWAVSLVATNQSRVHAVTVHCMTRPVQATTCVSLSNTMILQGVFHHRMRNEQKCPLSSMQVSHPQIRTQKDI